MITIVMIHVEYMAHFVSGSSGYTSERTPAILGEPSGRGSSAHGANESNAHSVVSNVNASEERVDGNSYSCAQSILT